MAPNQQRKANFQVFRDTKYIVSESYNLITNITGKLVSTLTKCSQQCLEYELCETATYYIQARICSLYQERYGLGQLASVASQTASVIIINNRNPSGNVKQGIGKYHTLQISLFFSKLHDSIFYRLEIHPYI